MNTNIKSIVAKITAWYNVNKNLQAYVYADYFNNSFNDAENIFIELKKLVSDGHFYHHEYFQRRLNFLIEEGIDVTSVQTAALGLLVAEEYNQAVTIKKPTKKAVKPKKAVKKVNKPKRDKNGRFVSRR